MLGELIIETSGKRVLRRMLSSDPPTVEVTFEDGGKVLGVSGSGFGTYSSVVRADGLVQGEGQGAMITQDGEMVMYQGSGLGKLKQDGSVSYRGILYFRTASQKLARLNAVGGVFEYDVDAEGKTHTKIWEWK